MSALPTTVYVEIVGEPFFTAAKSYMADWMAWRKAWSAFSISRGAQGHCANGLTFGRYGKTPEGWNKPKGANGWSTPKKWHPDANVIAAMPPEPSTRDPLPGLIYGLSHEDFNELGIRVSWGSGGVGHLSFGPWIGWLHKGDRFFAKIPHAGNAAANWLAEHPRGRLTTDCAFGWKVPAGLTEITEAEYRLAIAQDAVDEEREGLATPSPTANHVEARS